MKRKSSNSKFKGQYERNMKRQKDRVIGVSTKKRKFNGKVFTSNDAFKSKRYAKQMAESYRDRGWKARVLKVGGVWRIYRRS